MLNATMLPCSYTRIDAAASKAARMSAICSSSITMGVFWSHYRTHLHATLNDEGTIATQVATGPA